MAQAMRTAGEGSFGIITTPAYGLPPRFYPSLNRESDSAPALSVSSVGGQQVEVAADTVEGSDLGGARQADDSPGTSESGPPGVEAMELEEEAPDASVQYTSSCTGAQRSVTQLATLSAASSSSSAADAGRCRHAAPAMPADETAWNTLSSKQNPALLY